MQESSLTISPVTKKIATGAAIGMCAGILAAPEKYSLKRLLVQDSDTFSKIFTPSVTKNMNAAETNALDEIKKASSEILSAGNSEKINVKNAAVDWAAKFKGVAIDEVLAQNVLNKKNYLKKIADETDFVAKRKDYTQARELLLQDLDNKFMRKYYYEAKEEFKAAKRKLKQPIQEYRDLVKEAYTQRVRNLNKHQTKGIEVKTAYEKLQKAIAAKRTLTSNKLFEMINQGDLKKNYKAISRFLPKARTRAAIQGALILSTLTAMGIIFFNPSPPNNN